MKRRFSLSVICILSLAAVAFAAQNLGPETLTLSGGKSGDVPLKHRKHQDALKDCNLCHEQFPQKGGAIDQLKADGKLKGKEIMNKLCIKCHREKKREDVATGPTSSCRQCHVKD